MVEVSCVYGVRVVASPDDGSGSGGEVGARAAKEMAVWGAGLGSSPSVLTSWASSSDSSLQELTVVEVSCVYGARVVASLDEGSGSGGEVGAGAAEGAAVRGAGLGSSPSVSTSRASSSDSSLSWMPLDVCNNTSKVT